MLLEVFTNRDITLWHTQKHACGVKNFYSLSIYNFTDLISALHRK